MSNFVDADSYQGKSDALSFEFVVLEHMRRITRLASKEWHGGRMIMRSVHPNSSEEQEAFYIESTSEAYSHAVECFMDLLLPFADEKLLEFEKGNDKEVKVVDDKLSKRYEDFEQKYGNYPTMSTAERWNEQHNRGVAIRRRKLFRACCLFLKRTDFFRGAGSFEEEVLQ